MLADCPTATSAYRTEAVMVQPDPHRYSARAVASGESWEDSDAELGRWLADPAAVVDAGAVAPSRMLIRIARSWAARLRSEGWPAPDAVVPDGEGGISFEFYAGDLYTDLAFRRDGGMWITELRGGRFQRRQQIGTIVI